MHDTQRKAINSGEYASERRCKSRYVHRKRFEGTSSKKKWTAEALAERISCDRTTIFRYESGKLKPDPDIMHDICDALEEESVWITWMRTEYPRSYAKVHPEIVPLGLSGSVLMLYAYIDDVNAIQRRLMCEGANEHITDIRFADDVWKMMIQLIACSQRIKMLVEHDVKLIRGRGIGDGGIKDFSQV